MDPDREHVAHLLQQAGYETALIGKWHLKTRPTGFDYWNIIKGQGSYRNPTLYEMDLEQGRVQEGSYSTDVFTDAALRWLGDRTSDRPFLLMLHFKATHEPWQFHPRHRNLYKDVRFPEPETLMGPTGPENSVVPGWPLEILTDRMTGSSRYGDGRLKLTSDDSVDIRRATYQKLIADFLRCAASIDENIGRVIEFLDRSGLSENTVLIYTSDQGYFLGEHNYFDKRFMLEESLRMPFVIRYPAEIEPGSGLDQFILNVDFAPTLLDFAGAAPGQDMQGKSFRSLLQGSEGGWRDSVYYRYFENSERRPSHFGIRTERFKLIYYDGLTERPEEERWELYDLEEDPRESRNAYGDPAYRDQIQDLKSHLRALREEFGDHH